jgi:hypothetical protein
MMTKYFLVILLTVAVIALHAETLFRGKGFIE